MTYRRILLIAGSDSSGGAGLEADQKVVAAHGCYAMTATTALTAQNTTGVFGIHQTPPEFVEKQIDVVVEDVGVDVVKTGMLASAETIRVVADALRRWDIKTTVVDPVMVSTSGSQLLPENAVKTLIKDLLPLTTILTPNIPEAKLLLLTAGIQFNEPKVENDLARIAMAVQSLGPKYVLLKGGHLPFNKHGAVATNEAERAFVKNVLVSMDGASYLNSAYLRSKNTHGTGCSLASAIAANLARNMRMDQAVVTANRYVEAGISTSKDLGKGHGPINHFHSTYTLPFAPGKFIDYMLERTDVKGAWRDHTHHEFVRQMQNGTLPLENFKMYLIQDYLFLIQFARANSLAAYKANDVDDIDRSAAIVRHIFREMNLHIDYCKGFGLSKRDIMNHEEKMACTAYTRYVLDVGQAEDWFALQIALLPCLLGYGMIARRLFDDPTTKREGNLYWKWVENYVADDYTEAVKLGCQIVERRAVNQSPSRIEELVKIFIHATRMETGFWDMGGEG